MDLDSDCEDLTTSLGPTSTSIVSTSQPPADASSAISAMPTDASTAKQARVAATAAPVSSAVSAAASATAVLSHLQPLKHQ